MNKIAYVSKECVACGTCMKVCPKNAINVKNGIKAYVDANCVGCGKCVKICPCCVITLENRGESYE
ncbi:MAG: 4Fe-4S dicluster domain-containing protein [Lachnospirales bacterium]